MRNRTVGRRPTVDDGRLALALHGVQRRYGGRTALHPLSLGLEHGAVVLVEGGNGAGKTTMLRLAAGLLRPTGGTRRCRGRAIYLRPDAGGRAVERVLDAVRFAARIGAAGHGLPPGATRSRADEALDLAGLDALAHRRVGTLSAGEHSRLAIALVRAARPAVACLDEPTAHLDRDGLADVARAVRVVADFGTAVLLATHDARALAACADGGVRLCAGRAVDVPARLLGAGEGHSR